MNLNPFLQYRHALGLGDFIACTLHSKYINPITKAITGKDGLCASCDIRRQSLNILFPIPFWKLFFKTENDRNQNIEKFLTYKNEKGEEIPYSLLEKNKREINDKNEDNLIYINHDKKIIKKIPEIEIIENYEFINSSDVELDNYILRTIIYKKI